ncbi:hypothetical protein AB4238_07060, partial [Shewanella sp. 10N.286.45.A1]|uniref:hypothetical protein n=1 Tax=Shewanella sp. 10N.286.45.A1 TaxID=3229694 RepID=UPI00354E9EF5
SLRHIKKSPISKDIGLFAFCDFSMCMLDRTLGFLLFKASYLSATLRKARYFLAGFLLFKF